MKKKVPVEYHQVIGRLFPESVWVSGELPEAAAGTGDAAITVAEAIDSFAEALGIASNYTRLKQSIAEFPESGENAGSDAYGGGLAQFLARFQGNFDLMIAKTWVEKDDEDRKEQLLWKIPDFVKQIEAGEYRNALVEFSSVIRELAYLLFGEQSLKDDFLDYTFRIDLPMGLFFWYGLHLSAFFDQNTETARNILLLGMCYLTDF
jgi:hypothetical protein